MTSAALIVAVLSGCSAGADADPADTGVHQDTPAASGTSAPPTTSVAGRPALLTDGRSALEGLEVRDVALVEAATGVSLPAGATCVVTWVGNVADSTGFDVFWDDPNGDVLGPLSDALFDAGYVASADLNNFGGGPARVSIDSIPGGDYRWSGAFGDRTITVIEGQFDGLPGAVTERSKARHLTWQSACMLTADELDEAFATMDVTFSEPLSPEPASSSCSYQMSDGGSLDVAINRYSSTGSYDGGWTAPSASVGAMNACAAQSVSEQTGLDAICDTFGPSPVVIRGGRNHAIVFGPDGYFYRLTLFGVTPSSELTTPMTNVAQIIALRTPLDR